MNFILGFFLFFLDLGRSDWILAVPRFFCMERKRWQETLLSPWEPKAKQQELLIVYFYPGIIYIAYQKLKPRPVKPPQTGLAAYCCILCCGGVFHEKPVGSFYKMERKKKMALVFLAVKTLPYRGQVAASHPTLEITRGFMGNVVLMLTGNYPQTKPQTYIISAVISFVCHYIQMLPIIWQWFININNCYT